MTSTRNVRISVGPAVLQGDLAVPAGAGGVVCFAHGTGSSRHSPRNRRVAAALNEGRFATLLLDLLTEDEEGADALTGRHRFDIELLAQRLDAAIAWLQHDAQTASLPLGLFGASTGAAAALVAAAQRETEVAAVVSRGGRPDLAGEALTRVRAPTRLIVGEHDVTVLELNEQARDTLPGEVQVDVVPGATHLFEEPGALDRVAALGRAWYERYLLRAEGAPSSS